MTRASEAMALQNIATISEHIDGLAGAKRLAEQQIDAALGTLRIAHQQIVKAAEHLVKLTPGTGGGALGELAEYAQVAREITAEAVLALSRLRPDKTPKTGPHDAVLVADARTGMHGKRLAKWEADALREAVVEELAGGQAP